MRGFAIIASAIVLSWPTMANALTAQELRNVAQIRHDLKACNENSTLTNQSFQRLDRVARDLLEDKFNPALTRQKMSELETGVQDCIEKFGLVALIFKLVDRRMSGAV